MLLLQGQAHVWQLAALQAVYGAAEAFFGPASTAVVPQTIDSGDLQQANALMALSGNVAAVLGPAFAGVIVATIGSGWGLAIDAGTFVASAIFLALMRVRAGDRRVAVQHARRAAGRLARRSGRVRGCGSRSVTSRCSSVSSTPR